MDIATGAALGALGGAFAYFYPRGGMKAIREEWPVAVLFAVLIGVFGLLAVAGVELGVLDAAVILVVLFVPLELLRRLLERRVRHMDLTLVEARESQQQQTDCPAEQPSPSVYLEGIGAAITVYLLASIGLTIVLSAGLIDADLSIEDEIALYVLVELVAFVVGIIVGVRYARLAGWRVWLFVIAGSVAGWLGIVYLSTTFGEVVLLGALGGGVAWLVLVRRKRS